MENLIIWTIYDAASFSVEILCCNDSKKLNLYKYSDNGWIGGFLEVNLDYPDKFPDLRHDYSLAAEKK